MTSECQKKPLDSLILHLKKDHFTFSTSLSRLYLNDKFNDLFIFIYFLLIYYYSMINISTHLGPNNVTFPLISQILREP